MKYALLAHCPTCGTLVEAIYLQGPEDSRGDAYTFGWLSRGLELSSGWVEGMTVGACVCEPRK